MAAEKRSTAGKHTCPKRRSLPAAEGIPTLSRERAQQSKTAKAALPMAQKISRKYCASSQLQSLFDKFTLAQRKGKIKGHSARKGAIISLREGNRTRFESADRSCGFGWKIKLCHVPYAAIFG
jgi:hypothetical protein